MSGIYLRDLTEAYSGCVGLVLVASRIGMNVAILTRGEKEKTPQETAELIRYFSGNYFAVHAKEWAVGFEYLAVKIGGEEVLRHNSGELERKQTSVLGLLERSAVDLERGEKDREKFRELLDFIDDVSHWSLDIVSRCKQGRF